MNYYQLILTIIMLICMMLFTWMKSPEIALFLTIALVIAVLVQAFRMFSKRK